MSQEKTQGIYVTQEDIDTALHAARRPETISDTDDGKPLFPDESDIADPGLENDSEEADYFGLLSREDIEALLHDDPDGSRGREAQDEIDSLFQTTGAGKERPATGEAAPSDKKNTARVDVAPEFFEPALVEPEPGEGNDAESIAPEAFDETESLISQPDLGRLMGGGPAAGDASDAPADGPRSASEHISQDDINRLLKESLDEAEELLGEEADPADADESDFQEPVILAADEEPAEPSSPDSKPAPAEKIRKTVGGGGWEKRIRSKRVVWAAAAVIFLFISITALMMSSEPTETAPQPRVMTFSLDQTGGDSPGATVLSDTRIRLPGFVVLAPPNSASVTYVAVDLTLEVSDTAIVAVIKENEAFVRDIIYGTIRNELVTRDISTIDEISLEPAIRKALGRVVAREAIGRIAFDRFSLV